LAIFIFSILVTTIFGSFNFLLKNEPVLNDIIEIQNMGNRSLQRILTDLESIRITPPTIYKMQKSRDVSDPFAIKGGKSLSGLYGNPALRFSSQAHLPIYGNSDRGVAEIVYYLEKISQNTGVLKRSDRLFNDTVFEPSEKDPVICESVISFNVSFFDKQGNEYDHWDSESREFYFSTPSAIGIFIKISGKSEIHDFGTVVKIPVGRDEME
jgi:general secretion pathway protein J